MPLSEDGLRDVQTRVMVMLFDTIKTIDQIEKNADVLFGENANQIKLAIREYMEDFFRNTSASGEVHPETLIFQTPREKFQSAGFYGAQLAVKERQVTDANQNLRESLLQPTRSIFRNPFKIWIDRINNFLGSLASATGMSEALKELKDCLRDELPENDD